jgi:ribonuclease HI
MHKVIAYTDGACSGNPGPMGAGALLILSDQSRVKQISRPLGAGTNNIAELQAISLALSAIKPHTRSTVHMTIRTDSQYCIGVLSKGWKISANPGLVMAIKELIGQFARVELEKVKAHSTDEYNIWADNLAQQAVKGNIVNAYV